MFWVTCGGKMMTLGHGWGCHPIQTASCIHIKHIQSVWAHWYAIHRHMVAALLSYTQPIWLRFLWSGSLLAGNNVIRHGWGCHPIQTSSHIHIRHVQYVWAHWKDVHRHTVVALLSYTHPTWLRSLMFWVSCGGKMMSFGLGWACHPLQTDSPIHIRHMQSVSENFYAVQRHMVAVLPSYIHPTWLRFLWSGSLLEAKWCH